MMAPNICSLCYVFVAIAMNKLEGSLAVRKFISRSNRGEYDCHSGIHLWSKHIVCEFFVWISAQKLNDALACYFGAN